MATPLPAHRYAAPTVPPGCPMTTRQYGLMVRLADGRSFANAAADLGIAASTARTHASAVYQALNVGGAEQAVIMMRHRGWLGYVAPALAPAGAGEPVPPFLLAYVNEFVRSRWPNTPSADTVMGMRLALAGQRNRVRGMTTRTGTDRRRDGTRTTPDRRVSRAWTKA